VNKQSEILRLKDLGLKERAIARAIGSSRKTVRKYLTESQPALVTEVHQLFTWEELIREHQVNDVSLQLLWDELKDAGKTIFQKLKIFTVMRTREESLWSLRRVLREKVGYFCGAMKKFII